MIDRRHEDEEPARHGGVRREPRPFVPSGSFATWTMISCPSFSSSSILVRDLSRPSTLLGTAPNQSKSRAGRRYRDARASCGRRWVDCRRSL